MMKNENCFFAKKQAKPHTFSQKNPFLDTFIPHGKLTI